MAGLGSALLYPYNIRGREHGLFSKENVVWSVDVIDRLSVLCFAGTYGLALLAELARFFVRSALRGTSRPP